MAGHTISHRKPQSPGPTNRSTPIASPRLPGWRWLTGWHFSRTSSPTGSLGRRGLGTAHVMSRSHCGSAAASVGQGAAHRVPLVDAVYRATVVALDVASVSGKVVQSDLDRLAIEVAVLEDQRRLGPPYLMTSTNDLCKNRDGLRLVVEGCALTCSRPRSSSNADERSGRRPNRSCEPHTAMRSGSSRVRPCCTRRDGHTSRPGRGRAPVRLRRHRADIPPDLSVAGIRDAAIACGLRLRAQQALDGRYLPVPGSLRLRRDRPSQRGAICRDHVRDEPARRCCPRSSSACRPGGQCAGRDPASAVSGAADDGWSVPVHRRGHVRPRAPHRQARCHRAGPARRCSSERCARPSATSVNRCCAPSWGCSPPRTVRSTPTCRLLHPEPDGSSRPPRTISPGRRSSRSSTSCGTRIGGDAAHAVCRSFDYYRHHFEVAPHTAFVLWQTDAWARFHALVNQGGSIAQTAHDHGLSAEHIARFVYDQADWILRSSTPRRTRTSTTTSAAFPRGAIPTVCRLAMSRP